jgi:hypothetical protein
MSFPLLSEVYCGPFKFIDALHKLLTGRVVCRGVSFAPGSGGLRSIAAHL